jgi:hypothetical protein
MSAYATLAAVVVGAVLAGGSQVVLDRIRERRTLRVASRLVGQELRVLYRALAANGPKDARLRPEDLLRYERLRDVWTEYRFILATRLNAADWRTVADAVFACDLIFDGAKPGRMVRMHANSLMAAAQSVADGSAVLTRIDKGPEEGPERG